MKMTRMDVVRQRLGKMRRDQQCLQKIRFIFVNTLINVNLF